MLKRAVTGAATLVGLVLVISAVMGAMLLGVRGTWHTELEVPAGRSAVVLPPSLASVIGPQVQVEANGPAGVALFAGRARPDDAAALVGSVDRLEIDGLDGARRLAASARAGAQVMPAPAGLDVWSARATGTGAVRLTYRATPGAQTVVVARADGQPLPAMQLRVGWSDRTWLLVPAVLLLLGLTMVWLARRWCAPSSAGRARSAGSRGRQGVSRSTPPIAGAPRPPRARPSSGSAPSKHVGRRRAPSRSGRRG